MDIYLNDNVIFESVSSDTQLKQRVCGFILKSKTNKILFKGNPNNLNYKSLKSVFKTKCTIKDNTIYMYMNENNDCDIRSLFKNFINKIGCNYCIIYKK